MGIWFENVRRRRSDNPFRTFVHPPSEMMRIIERQASGLRAAAARPRGRLMFS
jgi:hypothetical protein